MIARFQSNGEAIRSDRDFLIEHRLQVLGKIGAGISTIGQSQLISAAIDCEAKIPITGIDHRRCGQIRQDI